MSYPPKTDRRYSREDVLFPTSDYRSQTEIFLLISLHHSHSLYHAAAGGDDPKVCWGSVSTLDLHQVSLNHLFSIYLKFLSLTNHQSLLKEINNPFQSSSNMMKKSYLGRGSEHVRTEFVICNLLYERNTFTYICMSVNIYRWYINLPWGHFWLFNNKDFFYHFSLVIMLSFMQPCIYVFKVILNWPFII